MITVDEALAIQRKENGGARVERLAKQETSSKNNK